jgi:hypothetical protein
VELFPNDQEKNNRLNLAQKFAKKKAIMVARVPPATNVLDVFFLTFSSSKIFTIDINSKHEKYNYKLTIFNGGMVLCS